MNSSCSHYSPIAAISDYVWPPRPSAAYSESQSISESSDSSSDQSSVDVFKLVLPLELFVVEVSASRMSSML